MKRCLLPLIIICLAQMLCAQAPLVKMWDKRFGGTDRDWLNGFQQTTDGGYILGGASYSGISGDKTQPSWGYKDFWVVKIDMRGNKQWDKRFGGEYSEELFSLQQTTDEGYILGGYSVSDSIGDMTEQSRGRGDFWIVKIDSLGSKQWDRRFGGDNSEGVKALQQTTDGGYILGGTSHSGFSGDKTQENWDSTQVSPDYWVVKIDSLGNKQWDKRFGGTNWDVLAALQQTTDGGYILGGESRSEVSGDKTQPYWDTTLHTYDYWVVKIDSLGSKQWDKRFGGIYNDGLNSLQQTIDGGYILGGGSQSGISGDKTQPSRGYWDYWIVKIDSAGNKQWDKGYGGIEADGNKSIHQTFDGGYILSGWSYSPADGDKSENNLLWGYSQTWLVKIDAIGNKEWDKTIFSFGTHPSEIGHALQAQDSCYVIANYTNSGIGGYKTQPNWDTTNTNEDLWILKFCDSTLIAACASFKATTNSVTAHVTCLGASDGAAKAVASGGTPPYTFLWSDGQADDSPTDLSAGAHSVTVTDANGCTATTSINIGEGTEPCVGIQDNSFNNISLHPNPTNNTLTITATIHEQATLALVDALGKEVWQQTFFADALKAGAQLSLSEQEQGIYFLSIRTTQGSKVMKVVKY